MQKWGYFLYSTLVMNVDLKSINSLFNNIFNAQTHARAHVCVFVCTYVCMYVALKVDIFFAQVILFAKYQLRICEWALIIKYSEMFFNYSLTLEIFY